MKSLLIAVILGMLSVVPASAQSPGTQIDLLAFSFEGFEFTPYGADLVYSMDTRITTSYEDLADDGAEFSLGLDINYQNINGFAFSTQIAQAVHAGLGVTNLDASSGSSSFTVDDVGLIEFPTPAESVTFDASGVIAVEGPLPTITVTGLLGSATVEVSGQFQTIDAEALGVGDVLAVEIDTAGGLVFVDDLDYVVRQAEFRVPYFF